MSPQKYPIEVSRVLKNTFFLRLYKESRSAGDDLVIRASDEQCPAASRHKIRKNNRRFSRLLHRRNLAELIHSSGIV